MTPTPAKKISLDSGWEWKQRDHRIGDVVGELKAGEGGDGWRKATQFPSEVHVELMKAGMIPDPYVGFNEHEVQWVGEVEWLWRGVFDVEGGDGRMGMLEFEGLDTLCDVYLNDTLLFSADNQFRTWRHFFPLLPSSSPHYTLLLHFKSAKLHAKAEEARYGAVRAGSTNLGDPSRVYVRKAQYDWRWDWGPELMTCGPYRPITLTTYTKGARIKDVYPRATLVEGYKVPKLEVDVTLDSVPPGFERKVRVMLKEIGSAVVVREEVFPVGAGEGTTTVAKWEFREGEVEKWWPSGYGAQRLYDVVVELLVGDTSTTIHATSKRIGFRTISLIQEPLLEPDQYGLGTSFLFEVNGVRMFTGGSNYIPSSSLLTTISPTRYRRLLTLLRSGNQNMVRIWGGGVFEPDCFYDLCDELGLLIWHDFMFACGIYPGSPQPDFLKSVEHEATDALKRLRHHPAMALWCGNNEDYQQVLQWDLTSPAFPRGENGEISKEEKDKLLPAWVIYEELLPRLVRELMPSSDDDSTTPYYSRADSSVSYWPGSPYGGSGWDTSDPTRGDVHQWDVWGGKERAWQEYPRMGGRYVSEFGIPSFPDMKTVRYWMGVEGKEEWQWHAQSPIMAQHNRAGSHERRFAIVMGENFKVVEDLERHVYTTQLMQSEAVGLAYRSWRRGWKGRGREYTSGVLVWQANDCWPVTSWAIIDYFLRPKPVFYTIARSLASLTISLHRRVPKNRPTDRPEQFYEFGAFQEGKEGAEVDVWAGNGGLEGRAVGVEVGYYDLGDERWKTAEEARVVTLLPNQTTELGTLKIPAPARLTRILKATRVVNGKREVVDKEMKRTHSVVVSARLVDRETGEVVARAVDWPQPYRYCEVPEPGVRVVLDSAHTANAGGEGEVAFRVTVKRPVKGLWLSIDDGEERDDPEGEEEPRWSDNSLDVVPGDEWVVVLRGLGANGWERIRNGDVKVKAAWLGREKAEEVRVEVA